MALPLATSYPPMDALLVDALPEGGGWQYEPKWDGFRCLAFRDGATVTLRSKSGQSLERYFPEVVEALLALKATKFVFDSELVVPVDHSISFDALLQRIHPAASRVRKLAATTPAIMIAFDLLVDPAGKLLTEKPLERRRRALEMFARRFLKGNDRIVLSPAATDLPTARRWFEGVGGALDGVVAKRLDMPYQSGNRHGMVKIKSLRTADCVVGGFRYATGSKQIGSLLLGLYNEKGLLDHVGFCSAFTAAERKKLAPLVEPLIGGAGFTGQKPGGPSRWTTARSSEWQPLVPKLVVEVRYDHFTAGRFRHGTRFLRWRPDKAPRQCLLSQVKQEAGVSPLKLLGIRAPRRRIAG